MAFDSLENLHVLIVGTGATYNFTKIIINGNGARLSVMDRVKPGLSYDSARGLTIDESNNLNFTYVLLNTINNDANVVDQNGTSLSGNIAGCGAKDSINIQGVVYVSCTTLDKIVTYSANFIGYHPGGLSTQMPELDYTRAQIEFSSENYYNDSILTVYYNVRASGSMLDDWDLRLILSDPNGIDVWKSDSIDFPTESLLSEYHQVSGSQELSGNWKNGTYTIRIYEENDDGELAFLSSATTNILLELGGLSSNIVVNVPAEPASTNQIDGFLDILNMGRSQTAKYLFTIIVLVALGYVFRKVPNVGIYSAVVTVGFFTYIGYIPEWIIILAAIIIIAGYTRRM